MTNINTNLIPVAVDYTSRDFYALREDLIQRVKYNIPEWQGTDTADFGIALVEAFAYMGDIANYYIDRMANESYLSTATQRQNLLNIAALYGYRPSGLQASSVTLSFGNSSGSQIVLPAGTQIFTNIVNNDATVKLIFTTNSSVTINANVAVAGNTVTCDAYNYSVLSTSNDYGVKIGTSTSAPNQRFNLSSNNIVEGTIRVYTTPDSGVTYTPWTEVTSLSEYNSKDTVFTVNYNSENYPYITFGDSVSGAIPLNDIYVQYYTGGGIVGNISLNQLSAKTNCILYVPGFNSAQLANANTYVSITNITSAVGGADFESNESIRANASSAVRTNQRIVSLQDYDRFGISIPGVGKAHAAAVTPTSVALFIAPYRDKYGVESYPGRKTVSTGTTLEMDDLISVTSSLLSTRTQIGTTVTVNPPTYIPIAIKLNFSSMSGFLDSVVKTNITTALQEYFSYQNVDFAQTVSVEDLAKLLIQVTGVKSIAIQDLYKVSAGATATLPVAPGTSISSGDNGLFTLNTTTNLITNIPTSIIISSLTTAGTYAVLDQAYSATVFNYSISNVTGSSATLTVGTPLVDGSSVAGATITVNGSAKSYASAFALVNASLAGTHVYNMVVANSAGSVTANYTVTVNTSNAA